MEYWYNLMTQQVERGPQSDYSQLMGPYPSEEQARRALEKAASNTKDWDDRERAFRDD